MKPRLVPAQELADFLVGRLRKIAVPQADRVERLGRARADGFVGDVGEFPARLRRADRALVIDSADGTRTTLQFTSPMRSEEVDGVPDLSSER